VYLKREDDFTLVETWSRLVETAKKVLLEHHYHYSLPESEENCYFYGQKFEQS
jgi:UV DNA damage repair endonuclease